MGRRGQGLPLNTIIIAIIVIVVLVVIILITTGQLNIFNKSLSGDAAPGTCTNTNGQCVAEFQCGDPAAAQQDCTVGLVCCPKSSVNRDALPTPNNPPGQGSGG